MKHKAFIDEKAICLYRQRATQRVLPTDHLYHEFTQCLLERLNLMCVTPAVIAHVGWHKQSIQNALQEKYASATIIHAQHYVELQSLETESVDFVIVHFAMLCEREPILLLQEVKRVLRNEGLLLFVEVGPDTLMELRASFSSIDNLPHVHPFADMHDIGDWMKELHFSDPVVDRENITLAYDHLDLLFEDLKQAGINNAHQARSRGLLSKNKWQTVLLHYEQYKKEDYFPATLEIIYGHAWKVKSDQSDRALNEVTISVNAIGRR